MGLARAGGSESRFARYVEGIVSVIGHATRAEERSQQTASRHYACARATIGRPWLPRFLNILLVREDSERFLQHCEPPVMLAELRIGHDLVHPALGLKFAQFGSQVLPHYCSILFAEPIPTLLRNELRLRPDFAR